MSTQEWKLKVDKSRKIFDEALKYTPMGVPSVVQGRPFWDPHPIVVERGEGSKIYDVDGNCYIDYYLGAGPLILGHSPPKVIEAVKNRLDGGTQYWAPTELHVEAARKVVGMVPSVEKVCFCSSGSEATYHAIRVSRAYTGRDKILKFEGQYNGWHDYVLIGRGPPTSLAGLEVRPNRVPGSAGIPQGVINDILVAVWNNIELLEKTIRSHKHELAAVITAPIPANPVMPPKEGYLKALRELTEENDIILIFDEVITGFRVAPGGGQELYGVTPDLTTMAKALGGGFPIGAYGGKAEIMEVIGADKVVHAGTYNANPLCLAACLATLEELEEGVLRQADEIGVKVMRAIRDAMEAADIDGVVQGVGTLFMPYFTGDEGVDSWRDYLKVEQEKLGIFLRGLVEEGIWILPVASSHFFTSSVHTDQDADMTIKAIEKSLAKVK